VQRGTHAYGADLASCADRAEELRCADSTRQGRLDGTEDAPFGFQDVNGILIGDDRRLRIDAGQLASRSNNLVFDL